ncbi:MAG: 2-phospho-L-lactate transferase [Candidatus Lokiarchaeota archaeon]|nr:2-phospho-L-lactate transferase [Candidatus Lokiarchaeota archaeon]
MDDLYYLVLAGGVGAAKFIEGLANVIDPALLKIVINTGDDIELYGLQICPDIDIITYTLAGIVDKEKGWGFQDESYNCLKSLKQFYDYKWFNLGDKDLATHIYRTDLFKKGFSKAEVTMKITEKMGIKSHLIPMTNEKVQTIITTDSEEMHFEEFFIRYKCKPKILDIKFQGIDKAKPVIGVLDYIKHAEKILICPSNPVVSIGTILTIPGIREALKNVKHKVIAISPIIEGATIKGPADKMMIYLGYEVSCVGVAHYYGDVIGHFIIDNKDRAEKPRIEELDIDTYCFDTLMVSKEKKTELAKFVLNLET